MRKEFAIDLDLVLSRLNFDYLNVNYYIKIIYTYNNNFN